MRARIVCLLINALCIMPVVAHSQEHPPTQLEALMRKTGSLIARSSTTLRDLKGLSGATVEISKESVRDIEGGRIARGFFVRVTEADTANSSSAFVDESEVQALLEALRYMRNHVGPNERIARSHVQFRTKDNLILGLYRTAGAEDRVLIQSGLSFTAVAYFTTDALPELLDRFSSQLGVPPQR
jgi:hypothetical protein